MSVAQYTPMIQQYLTVKQDYQDAFLFYRLGDFYELFFEDALLASKELEITLTGRSAGVEERIPMCGVPYHAAENYIEKLIEKGYKVAICEQVGDPKTTKGVVKREVVRLITPGTVMAQRGLNEQENNYIAALIHKEQRYGFVYGDISTGQLHATLIDNDFFEVLNELNSLQVKELILQTSLPSDYQQRIEQRGIVLSQQTEMLLSTHNEHLFSELEDQLLIEAGQLLISYLERTQKRSLDYLQPFKYYILSSFLKIDHNSKRNLELTSTIIGNKKQGSLLWVMDDTATAMGARKLKQWLDKPLIDIAAITRRQNIVQSLIDDYFTKEDLREALKDVYDIERLVARVAYGNVNAKDLVQLLYSLQKVPQMITILTNSSEQYLVKLASRLTPLPELVTLLENALVDQPPLTIKEGGMIKKGYHEELDKLREAKENGTTWLIQLEQQERERTGIKSLKINFNKVFGYFIEIRRSQIESLDLEQLGYERKQTLANTERFITSELKEQEALILGADDKMIDLEYQLFLDLREQVKTYVLSLQKLADNISQIDVLQSFAHLASQQNYQRPQFTEQRDLTLLGSRHPVVEKMMDKSLYVDNDCIMPVDKDIFLITGPNMSGKSTYMRQVALLVIMAQVGSFLPVTSAVLPIFDQIFTRIGAADDLSSGKSTFMVEMLEAKQAMRHATSQSLIIFDELGRGTSTFDGMALAQAIIEYIAQHIHAKTLFSTHYHELTELTAVLPTVENVHVSAVEQSGRLVFLHKVKKGAIDQSYGIHVAKLADLPDEIIHRANSLLTQFEQQSAQDRKSTPVVESTVEQLSLFETSSAHQEIVSYLQQLDIDDVSPKQALSLLYDLKNKL